MPCSGALFGNVSIYILLFNGAENPSGITHSHNGNTNSQGTQTDIKRFRNHFVFRTLGFHRVPPHSGRVINATYDIKRHADSALHRTFFISPGN